MSRIEVPPDQLIEVRGTRLRVRTAGNGPAVLFVHGWTLDLDMWRAQFPALAGDYRLIAFDRRGFGLSAGTPGIAQDLADIDDLRAALGVERMAIVGMSQGARIALRWAIRYSRRTTCLVLDGPPREKPPAARNARTEIPIASYRELISREGIAEFRKWWLRHPFMRLRTKDPGMRALLREMIERYPGLDLLACEELEPLWADDLRRLDLPVLVINGEHDSNERRAAGFELARLLPNARLSIISQAGHIPSLDNPTAYNQQLKEFLGAGCCNRQSESPRQGNEYAK